MIDVQKTDAGLWTLVLNRPEKANALTTEMLSALEDAVQCAGAEGAKALVLTGAGRVFSAGADLDAARAGLATDPVWARLSDRIAALPCLTIAALNGTAAGGALGMVLACDLRLAVPGTQVFYPVMKLGFLPQPPDPRRLTRLIGPSRAAMILLAGARIPTDEALAWGLFDRVVAPEALLDEAAALAGPVLQARPGHAAAIKAMLARAS